jgi:4-diphosphocytidyl-2-C-methyl-D-erythritol kinase
MQLRANAKINLGLRVLRKRADGYHDIESIFIPVPLYDELRIEKANKVQFIAEGIPIPPDEGGNLCLRAYHLLQAGFSLPPVAIHLQKHIPIGAGLGGGSSDAAFVLKGLNELFELGLSTGKLEEYAAELGSDCVFFIRNQAALVSGKGEQLDFSIQLPSLGYGLIVYPNLHISTALAYSKVRPKFPAISLADLISKPKEEWQELITNDFEDPMLREFPELKPIQQQLVDQGAYYVSMSGSGSAFFGLFDHEPTLGKWNKQIGCMYFPVAFSAAL